MTTLVKRLSRLLLAYVSTTPLIFGWVAGLICHRIHDGWVFARRNLDQLDDVVIEEITAMEESKE